MKKGDHNPGRNLRVLRELVNELKKQQVEVLHVSTLEGVIDRMEGRRG